MIPVHEIAHRYLGKTIGKRMQFVFLEEIIAANLEALFPGMQILESHPFPRDAQRRHGN